MTTDAAAARSWLFVPAIRPDRFSKAAASGADMVIIDLEDSVPAESKVSARQAAVNWFAGGGIAAVRINPSVSEYYEADVASLMGLPGLRAVLLPMAESPKSLFQLRELGDNIALVPQIETARGLVAAPELAASPGVARLAFGHLDFAVDIDARPEQEPLLYARSSLVAASRVARISGPVDSVTTDLDDENAARADAVHARALGFTGKLCIHPQQVAIVNAAMSPTPDEIAWSKRILAAGTTGAARVDGQMVDPPVTARAERILSRAGAATP